MSEELDDEEHFPWSYTEFGVLCWCGEAMDSDERCLSLGAAPEGDTNGE